MCQDEKSTTMNYYLNDGVYGSFNNLVYDHAIIKPPLRQLEYMNILGNGNLIAKNSLIASLSSIFTIDIEEDRKTPVFFSRFFGPTCDGFDVIMEIELGRF